MKQEYSKESRDILNFCGYAEINNSGRFMRSGYPETDLDCVLFEAWMRFNDLRLVSPKRHKSQYSQHRKRILAEFERCDMLALYETISNAVQWYNSIQHGSRG